MQPENEKRTGRTCGELVVGTAVGAGFEAAVVGAAYLLHLYGATDQVVAVTFLVGTVVDIGWLVYVWGWGGPGNGGDGPRTGGDGPREGGAKKRSRRVSGPGEFDPDYEPTGRLPDWLKRLGDRDRRS